MMRQQLNRCRLGTSGAIPATFQPAITSSFSVACFLRLTPFPLHCSLRLTPFPLHCSHFFKSLRLHFLLHPKSIGPYLYLRSFRLFLTTHNESGKQGEDANDCCSAEFLLWIGKHQTVFRASASILDDAGGLSLLNRISPRARTCCFAPNICSSLPWWLAAECLVQRERLTSRRAAVAVTAMARSPL